MTTMINRFLNCFVCAHILCGCLFAQRENPLLKIEFSYAFQQMNMDDINQYIFLSQPIDQKEYSLRYINHGHNYKCLLRYGVHSKLDLFLWGGYNSVLHSTPWYIKIPVGEGSYEPRVGERLISANALSYGLGSALLVSRFFKGSRVQKIFNRLNISLNVEIGFARSKSFLEYNYPSLPLHYSTHRRFNSRGFAGSIGLSIDYDVLLKPLVISMGLRSGYQYLKTNTLKDPIGNPWYLLLYKPVKLDFSGFFVGPVLRISR